MLSRLLNVMITRISCALLISLLLFSNIYAAQSVITEAEGYACTGKKKLTKQARKKALEASRKKTLEFVAGYIKNNNSEPEKYILEAYSRPDVKILEPKDTGWYKDRKSGNCFKVLIKAEVVPDSKIMEKAAEDAAIQENPSAPLYIQLWTDKKEYNNGDKIKIYFKGNKPFYARIHYKDSKGLLSQLLPNPYREEDYFNAGTVYEIPSGNDKFELEAMPPFKKESITVYAGTAPLGDLRVGARGSVYRIETGEKDIAGEAKKLRLKGRSDGDAGSVYEYFENNIVINIKKEEDQQIQGEVTEAGKTQEPAEESSP